MLKALISLAMNSTYGFPHSRLPADTKAAMKRYRKLLAKIENDGNEDSLSKDNSLM